MTQEELNLIHDVTFDCLQFWQDDLELLKHKQNAFDKAAILAGIARAKQVLAIIEEKQA